MFERFTDRARRVLVVAQDEARLLRHNFIGTEHILLGLVQVADGVAAQALEALGVSLQQVRERVGEMVGPAASTETSSPAFTPRAKKVLELALREALQLNSNYIGTEHLLLGIVREGEGGGAEVLRVVSGDLARVREEVLRRLSAAREEEPSIEVAPAAAREVPPMGREWPRHPTRVIAAPAGRLAAEGLELRVVGVLVFGEAIEVLWRISGIPAAVTDLLQSAHRPAFDWSAQSPWRGPGFARIRATVRPEGAGREDWRPFVRIRDDAGTNYREARGTFEPQPGGEWAGATLFVPAPPEGAQLRLEWRGETLAIAE